MLTFSLAALLNTWFASDWWMLSICKISDKNESLLINRNDIRFCVLWTIEMSIVARLPSNNNTDNSNTEDNDKPLLRRQVVLQRLHSQKSLIERFFAEKFFFSTKIFLAQNKNIFAVWRIAQAQWRMKRWRKLKKIKKKKKTAILRLLWVMTRANGCAPTPKRSQINMRNTWTWYFTEERSDKKKKKKAERTNDRTKMMIIRSCVWHRCECEKYDNEMY